MPQIVPIRDLKNTANISVLYQESDEPVFITKNGYSDMVIIGNNKTEEMQSYYERNYRIRRFC